MSSTYSTRYQQIREQRAYEARVQAFGLPALLAPYTGARLLPAPPVEEPQVPTQQRRLVVTIEEVSA